MTLPASLSRRPLALLLDAGDTLIFMDYQALSEALASLRVPVEPERLERGMFVAKRAYQTIVRDSAQHESGWFALVRSLLLEAGIARAQAEPLLAPLRAIHDDFYFWRKVPSALPAALSRARAAGIRLGVISNSEGRLASVLERVGLATHFEVMIDSHVVGVSKPDPRIFELALSHLQLPAARALYAGDLPEVDLVGAEAAGMHGVLVDALGHYSDQPELPRVASVAELVDALIALPA